MLVIIGALIVIAALVCGFLWEKGNLWVLVQPAEAIIIFGAAIGGFMIASPVKVIKSVASSTLNILKGKSYSKTDYMEVLMLLGEVFYKIRKEGLISVENDVDNPARSPIFRKYPKFARNPHALSLVIDTLGTVMTTKIESHELESLIDAELDTHHEELMVPPKSVSNVADALPGLGIVAAVMGVVLTMQKIGESPEVLGHSIGAALVGTFLGVLMCYGFVGPAARNMEYHVSEEIQYLNVLKTAIIAFVNGSAPQVAVEFGRRVIPANVKPTFEEIEQAIRRIKK